MSTTSVRPCRQCGKTFRTAVGQKWHQRHGPGVSGPKEVAMHPTQRIYQVRPCPICGKGTKSVHKHMSRMHPTEYAPRTAEVRRVIARSQLGGGK